MNITNIKNASVNSFELQKFTPNLVTKANSNTSIINKSTITDKNDIASANNWQQSILMQGLSILENKLQMENSGSLLDKPENRPIEKFEEAAAELALLSKEAIFKTGSQAQANVSHQVVFELLSEAS